MQTHENNEQVLATLKIFVNSLSEALHVVWLRDKQDRRVVKSWMELESSLENVLRPVE